MKLLTVTEFAALLKVSKRQFHRLRKAGKLPEPKRYGGPTAHPRWLESDVDAFLEAGSVTQYRIRKRRDSPSKS